MPNVVLVGAQWGDEGKGKVTDLIARDFDYVVRYQGGNNAGHTVIHGEKETCPASDSFGHHVRRRHSGHRQRRRGEPSGLG